MKANKMSKSNDLNADFNALQDDFKELRNDVNSLFKHMGQGGQGAKSDMNDAVHEMGDDAKNNFEKIFAKPSGNIIHEFKKRPIISSILLVTIGFWGVRTFIK